MTYVLAISGGVDSMVLLDMMARSTPHGDLIVAHFDHGIRKESADDAQFVANAAKRYGIRFETKREELGPDTSEEQARHRRYAFLFNVAANEKGTVVTAHHLDDLVETIVINVTRGTGWRGLAPFNQDILRPFLDVEKRDLVAYATKHAVSWRDDATNATDAYLRNRLRKKTVALPLDTKRQLLALYVQQKYVRHEIEQESQRLIGDGPGFRRHFFTQAPPDVALECLRCATQGKLTRPQLRRALHAIKSAKSGAAFHAGNGIEFHFTTRQFRI